MRSRPLPFRWRLLLVAAGFAGGTAASWPVAIAAGLALAAGSLAARRESAFGAVLLALGIGAGVAQVRVRAWPDARDANAPEVATPGWVRLDGDIAALRPLERQGRPGGLAIDLDVQEFESRNGATVRPRHVRLLLWEGGEGWELGDRIRLVSRLRAPLGLCNDEHDSQAESLRRREIAALAVLGGDQSVDRWPGRSRSWILRWRGRIARALSDAAPGRAGGVLRALVVGDRAKLDTTSRDAFVRAGAFHVLSVSGLHLVIVFAAVRWLTAAVVAHLRWVIVRWPGPDVGGVAGLIVAALYGTLAGAEVATLRSLWMLAAVVLGSRLRRPTTFEPTVGLAALAMLVCEPLLVSDVGLQLSFLAVVAVVWANDRLRQSHPVAIRAGAWRKWLVEIPLVSLAACGVTAPIVLQRIGSVSIAGPLMELLVSPWMTWGALLPGLIGAATETLLPGSGAPLFRLAAAGLEPLMWMLDRLSFMPMLARPMALPDVWACAGVLGGLALLGPTRESRLVLWAAGLIAAVVGLLPAGRAQSELHAIWFDVGQGAAMAVRSPDGPALLVDAGPAWPGGDAGRSVVLPGLVALGWRPQTLILTHADLDHAGGVESVIRETHAREVLWARTPKSTEFVGALIDRVARKELASRSLVAGGRRAIGSAGLQLEVLHPPPGYGKLTDNDASLVSLIRFGAMRLLAPGDVEQAGERLLVTRAELRRGSNVVAVPHHGSRTSSTPDFVDRLTPAFAVVSAGRNNRWGMPHAEVLERWRRRGAAVLTTAEDGELHMTSDGQLLRVAPCRAGSGPLG